MSSSFSSFAQSSSPSSFSHNQHTTHDSSESQSHQQSQHHIAWPNARRPDERSEFADTTLADVIAARKLSCMQHFDLSESVYSPQNEWVFGQQNYSQTSAPAQTPRSVSLAYPAVGEPWLMQSTWSESNSMGVLGVSPLDGLKRQNSHQRASSTSTIASNGPASPYSFPSSHPHIANTDIPPFDHSIDLAKESSNTQQTYTDPAYLSANYYPQQYHKQPTNGNRFYNFAQDYSAQSMSNLDRPSPSTPSSVSQESDVRQQRVKHGNGESVVGRAVREQPGSQSTDVENRPLHPSVQLSRTESAAYQDELYNPANFLSTPASAAKPARPQVTTAGHRTLVNQYLESANMARSASPNSAVSRERSPFREGSELAPSEAWTSPKNPIQTAASRRQQMKLEREQAELAAHRPQLTREPTKTISPKDALLEFNEDQPPLIQDIVPVGYKQHFGGAESYADSSSAVKNTSYNTSTSAQQKNMAGFRAANADAFTTSNYNFSPPVSQAAATMQNPFQMGAYQHLTQLDPAYAAVSMSEPTPQFPATLTSMESSISDHTAVMSSQESTLTSIARPLDTRANTGTYTCTYHGCAQRFESPALLQKHKKEYHRSQQQQHIREALSVEASSESPRSTASPGPSDSGLTSAQILARNSQAGPHKCSRTNPSTGKPCNTVFSRPYDLTRHEDTIHNGRKHKVRCPYCREEKTFSRNDALTRHMRVVHPDVESFGKRSRRAD